MTLANAKVLYASAMENGRKDIVLDLLRRYPELKEAPASEKTVNPKPEVKKDGKVRKR